MTDTYQLKKIILIDSFWAGKTVLLDLDGHINLSGTNGAGKTTFLRLIPSVFLLKEEMLK